MLPADRPPWNHPAGRPGRCPGRDRGGGAGSGLGTGFLAFVGGSPLLQMALPLAVTLGIPLLGWVALVATAAAIP
ncbi:hypothetical protein [Kitasatospora sp. NPDC096140]|uniref:hypothetical protein n=1 Tax=Kitasatospora sp. NPDC096140 TaxID=3155425 RepID=UPI003326F981